MVQFLVKRLTGLVFVVIGVTFITFIMGYFAPGDPIRVMLGLHPNPVEYVRLRHFYGLDLPWYKQYLNFLKNLATFNLGYSFEFKSRAVWDILKDGVPVTLELGFWALVIELFLGVPLGILSALKANTWVDITNMAIMLTIYAIPVFVIGILAQVVLVWIDQHTGLSWPVANWGNTWQYTWSDIQFKLVPILMFAATGLAYFAPLSPTTMLELPPQHSLPPPPPTSTQEPTVIYPHRLRNAMLPPLTLF